MSDQRRDEKGGVLLSPFFWSDVSPPSLLLNLKPTGCTLAGDHLICGLVLHVDRPSHKRKLSESEANPHNFD